MELLIFALGGLLYGCTELCYRGHTHWSMLLTGGAIAATFYLLTPFLLRLHLPVAAGIGALIVTAYEFSVGLVVNLWFGWHVWDYSGLPGNLLGQICPRYSLYWFVLCLAFFAIIKYNKNVFF